MSIGQLRYDQVAFKGVHNSIDRKFSVVDQLKGVGDVKGCCAAIELDLHQHSDRWEWVIKHRSSDPSTPFRTVLEEIAAWADGENHQHSVVTIHLDLKNDPMDHSVFARKLDELLIAVFDDHIYRPEAVIGGHADLVRGARAGGWELMENLVGKFVFCITGRVKRKRTYARTDPEARVCFVDFAGSRGPSKTGHEVFANLFVDSQHYKEHLARLAARAGFITRGYNIVTTQNWRVARTLGLNILSTDVLDKPSYSLGAAGCAKLEVRRILSG